jgi:hypothetical protein
MAANNAPSRLSLIRDAVREHSRCMPRNQVFLPARVTIRRRNG